MRLSLSGCRDFGCLEWDKLALYSVPHLYMTGGETKLVLE